MKIGQEIECTWGSMKGEKFIIKGELKNGFYSCLHGNGKYYQYTKDCFK